LLVLFQEVLRVLLGKAPPALGAEKQIKSDEEWVKKGNDSAYLLG